VSSRSSIDFLPNRTLTQITIPATPSAATQSALASHRTSKRFPATTHASPKKTTRDDQMSVEKCRASASSARLWCFSAARASARERE